MQFLMDPPDGIGAPIAASPNRPTSTLTVPHHLTEEDAALFVA